MVVYIDNPKEFKGQLLKQICEFNQLAEDRKANSLPIRLATFIIKFNLKRYKLQKQQQPKMYLGINLIEGVQDPFGENSRILSKDMIEDLTIILCQ